MLFGSYMPKKIRWLGLLELRNAFPQHLVNSAKTSEIKECVRINGASESASCLVLNASFSIIYNQWALVTNKITTIGRKKVNLIFSSF